MNTSSFLYKDPFTSIQTAETYHTTPYSWAYVPTAYTHEQISTMDSLSYASSLTSLDSRSYDDHHSGYDMFLQRQPYQSTVDYSSYPTDAKSTGGMDSNKMDTYRYTEGEFRENMENQQGLIPIDYCTGPKPTEYLGRRPLQDVTNIVPGNPSSFQNNFKSRAIKIESSYRSKAEKVLITRPLRREYEQYSDAPKVASKPLPTKEVDMNFYSRAIVYDTEPKQNYRVSYSSEPSQETTQKGAWYNTDSTVNNIVGKKKPKSTLLSKRMMPELKLNTSYNSNGHVLVVAIEDDGVMFKNLLQDSYSTRAGFFEMKRC